ncbi:hypothetical protein [Rhizobium nepotum]|uniref:Uncharacterized protein n=1 Tax=Rhizobium nepotum 39/7 TaxID=1368418 RepID=A0ABR5CRJ9_9HYPH|nr:hypothetical protein [Rhizobium nepotum]KJF67405.1 hypothetical protein RS75_13075 [Rhizobium nepotum 39/7]
MNDTKIDVTLTGPAKVNGIREPAGKTVSVSSTLALQLAASGVLDPALAEQLSRALDMSDTALESDFQQAVEDAAAGRIEVMKAENLLEVATLENKLFDLTKETEEHKSAWEKALSDLYDSRKELTAERQKVAGFETELAAEKQARTDADGKLTTAQAELAKLTEKAATTPKPAAAKK